jgi:hypothetical protein
MVKRTFRSPSHRGDRRWRCAVCRKVAYSTWRYANWDAEEQARKGNRRERPYWSKRCQAYHVGSQPKRRKDP